MATQAQVKAFIAQIGPIIQLYAKNRGYKIASTVIAQACCESAFGTSSLGYKYHNYFGMKCGSSWKGKSVNMATHEEYTPGQLTSIRDNFRVYDSMEEGVAGYYDFINWSRYANLKTAATPKQYAEMLKADGYATSSTYVNTLMKIVNNYNLTAWDNFESAQATAPAEAPTVPQTVPNYLVGKTYTLQAEMKIRKGLADINVCQVWLQETQRAHGRRSKARQGQGRLPGQGDSRHLSGSEADRSEHLDPVPFRMDRRIPQRQFIRQMILCSICRAETKRRPTPQI